jgi:hypothetical protein
MLSTLNGMKTNNTTEQQHVNELVRKEQEEAEKYALEQGANHWGVIFQTQASTLTRIINEQTASRSKLAQDQHHRALDQAMRDAHAMVDQVNIKHTILGREALILTDEQVHRLGQILIHKIVPDASSKATRGYVNDIKKLTEGGGVDEAVTDMSTAITATRAALHLTLGGGGT